MRYQNKSPTSKSQLYKINCMGVFSIECIFALNKKANCMFSMVQKHFSLAHVFAFPIIHSLACSAACGPETESAADARTLRRVFSYTLSFAARTHHIESRLVCIYSRSINNKCHRRKRDSLHLRRSLSQSACGLALENECTLFPILNPVMVKG
jgi:hypothetical protein